jgi:hypothetical protein
MNTKKLELSTQAHYQIEAMCIALQRAARAPNADTLPYLVQSLALRITELNGGLMSLMNEGESNLEGLEAAVFGIGLKVAS